MGLTQMIFAFLLCTVIYNQKYESFTLALWWIYCLSKSRAYRQVALEVSSYHLPLYVAPSIYKIRQPFYFLACDSVAKLELHSLWAPANTISSWNALFSSSYQRAVFQMEIMFPIYFIFNRLRLRTVTRHICAWSTVAWQEVYNYKCTWTLNLNVKQRQPVPPSANHLHR